MNIGDRDDRSRSIKRKSTEEPTRARQTEPARARETEPTSRPTRPRESRTNRPLDRTGAPGRRPSSDLDRDAADTSSDPVAARPLTRRQADTASVLTGGGDTDFETLATEEIEDADSAPAESGDEPNHAGKTTSADAAERNALANDAKEALGSVNQSDSETYEEDGVTYTRETRQGARGLEVTTTAYEIDGVQYTETVTQGGNGGTTIRVEAVNGDQTEISETRTHSVPGDLENYLPEGYLDGIEYESDAASGATQQTVETTTVIDNSQDPPVSTVTNSSTTYSQEVVSGLPGEISEGSDGQSIQIHHGANSTPYNTATYENVEFDPDASGHTISYTEATRLDEQGNPQSSTTLSSEARLVGRGEDGHEVVISTRSDNIVDGQGRQTLVLTNQSQGTIPADPQAISDTYQHNLGLHDEALLERLQGSEGPWLDLRETTVYTDGGPGTGVTTTEFGELDQEGDSRSLTVVRNGETESHTYRLVSDGGDRIQTQTQVPGTDYNAVTDLQYGPDGTFESSSETTFEGETIASSSASRELAYPAGQPLPEEPPAGFSPQLWEQFRTENPQGPVYLDQMESRSQDDEGAEITSESSTYSSNSAQVGTAENDGPDGSNQGQFFLADGPQPRAMVMGPDGTLAEISSDGQISLDGAQVSEASNLGVQLASGNQALRTLIGELDGASFTPSRLGRALGPVSAAVGAFDLLRAGSAEQRTSGAGQLLGGAGSTLDLLGTAGRVGRLAKGAGIAGGVLTGGVGVYELFQGEYAKGTADLVAGGATVVALLLLTSNPVGAAVAGTIAVGASIVRIILDNEDPPEQPEWAF